METDVGRTRTGRHKMLQAGVCTGRVPPKVDDWLYSTCCEGSFYTFTKYLQNETVFDIAKIFFAIFFYVFCFGPIRGTPVDPRSVPTPFQHRSNTVSTPVLAQVLTRVNTCFGPGVGTP